jgi:DNA (cytosine-5)-methyltransferase 1
MKQSSLLQFLAQPVMPEKMKIVDLFCGLGGFSCGAKQAGHQVFLAVDNDKQLLKCHKDNNPQCIHICQDLPAHLPLPKSGLWHLHGSPPCTKLSIMKNEKNENEIKRALNLVSWFLDLATTCGATSWSMEQVVHKDVIHELEIRKRKHPLKFDFECIDAVDYNVPQHRKRVIAAPPFLIANLRFHPGNKKKRLSVRDVIPKAPRQYLRNTLYNRPDPKTGKSVRVLLKDKIRCIDKPSYTILATGHIKWADAEGKVFRYVLAKERALIQTFPLNYILPKRETLARIGVGNAVPPQLAKILMTYCV